MARWILNKSIQNQASNILLSFHLKPDTVWWDNLIIIIIIIIIIILIIIILIIIMIIR